MMDQTARPQNPLDNHSYDWERFTNELNENARNWAGMDVPIEKDFPGLNSKADMMTMGQEGKPYFMVVVGSFFRAFGYYVTEDDWEMLKAARRGNGAAEVLLRGKQIEVLGFIGVPPLPGGSYLEAWIKYITEKNGEEWKPGYMPLPLQRILRRNEAMRNFYKWLGAAELYYE